LTGDQTTASTTQHPHTPTGKLAVNGGDRLVRDYMGGGWEFMPAPPATLPDQTKATLLWLLDHQRLIPPHLLTPFCAAICGLPVTAALSAAVSEVDQRAQRLAEADPDSDELEALRQDVADALDAIAALPGGPAAGDRVEQRVGDGMLIQPRAIPALVLGVDGDQVTTHTLYGPSLVDVSRVTVVGRAVYVAVDQPGGAS
jgi:hypothetical protein